MIRSHLSDIARRAVASSEPTLAGPGSSGLSLPATLTGVEAQELLADVIRELRPVGAVEHRLVRQLAKHDAAAELWGEFALALARRAAHLLPVFTPKAIDAQDTTDALLAAALSPQAVRDAENVSHSRYRSFVRTLRLLLELQAARRIAAGRERPALPPGFTGEDECEAYLASWWDGRDWVCAKCGHESGYYLPARRAWECRVCHRQCGLRAGTVMADSALSLHVWFEAIRHVLWLPNISAKQLAEHLRIPRLPTVRRMIHLIQEALTADDASELLAGLDDYFTEAAANLSQVGADSASAAAAENLRPGFATP